MGESARADTGTPAVVAQTAGPLDGIVDLDFELPLPSGGTAHVSLSELLVGPEHPDDEEGSYWQICVSWRGKGKWAVCYKRTTLNADGEWEYESRPSAREDDYLERCRFDLPTAIKLAVGKLDSLTVNGKTYLQWMEVRLARERERHLES